MGFKKTIKCVLFKGRIHERQVQHTKEVHFELKIKRVGIFVFSGKDPSTEKINGHRINQSHGVA
jgi:hypothetical protein